MKFLFVIFQAKPKSNKSKFWKQI